MIFDDPDYLELVTCSRAGCTAIASFDIAWRNPKIHAPGRVKHWMACSEHREFLIDYLRSREFPIEVFNFDAEKGA